MVKIASLPKETVAELIRYLAEHESFASVSKGLEGGFTVQQVRALLREVADGLSQEAEEEQKSLVHELRRDEDLSSRAKEVMSTLSPREERRLLAAFGLITR